MPPQGMKLWGIQDEMALGLFIKNILNYKMERCYKTKKPPDYSRGF
jgi:hypothetical protein